MFAASRMLSRRCSARRRRLGRPEAVTVSGLFTSVSFTQNPALGDRVGHLINFTGRAAKPAQPAPCADRHLTLTRGSVKLGGPLKDGSFRGPRGTADGRDSGLRAGTGRLSSGLSPSELT